MAGRAPAAMLLVTFNVLGLGCVDKGASKRSDVAADSTFASGPRPKPETIASAVDSLAARVVAEGLTPALGVAVVMDGQTLLSKSYGLADVTNGVPADDRTLWYIASSSKSLTGFAASLLAHQGVIDFSTPITSLIPQAQWPKGVDASRLALARFLSHTHQLRDDAIVMTSSGRRTPGHDARSCAVGDRADGRRCHRRKARVPG